MLEFFYEPYHPQGVLPTLIEQRLSNPVPLISIQSAAHQRFRLFEIPILQGNAQGVGVHFLLKRDVLLFLRFIDRIG